MWDVAAEQAQLCVRMAAAENEGGSREGDQQWTEHTGSIARESVDSGGWRENKQEVHTENKARGSRDGAHC